MTRGIKKIGYMVSTYPSRSHTFIRREISELEKHQLDVSRFSQRRFGKSEILSQEDQHEYDSTFSVFPLRLFSLLFSHLYAISKNPFKYFSTLTKCFSRMPQGISGPLYALSYFLQGIYISREMRQKKIAFLHIHFVNSGFHVGVAAAQYLGIPWGVSVHGRSDFDYPNVIQLPWVTKYGGFLRCVSHYGASQAMRQLSPEYWDKLFVCYCGIPDTVIDQNRNISTHPPGSEIKLISVGRLSAEKGQVLLLKVANMLDQKRINYQINIVGDGPDREYLESMAIKLGVTDRCIFVGAIDEEQVYSVIREADIFLCPSLMEGLPQVLMEAMAVKKPVIAPYLSGIPELIENKRSGLLYSCGNWQELTDCVAELSVDKEMYLHCANHGYATVKQNFLLSSTILPLAQALKKFT